jgi:hypothetical protein
MPSNKIRSIEGVPIIYSFLLRKAAFTVPGVGIFASPSMHNDLETLKHEFGHILQARKWGHRYFFQVVGPTSIRNYYKFSKRNPEIYDRTWTEWSANYLSYKYFGEPADWNKTFFPISPLPDNPASFSPHSDGLDDFLRNWILGELYPEGLKRFYNSPFNKE